MQRITRERLTGHDRREKDHPATWVLRFAVGVLALAVAGACGPGGSGTVVEEARTVGAFNRLEVSAGIVVELTIDSAGTVSVVSVYDDNLQERIVTEVDGDTLVVGADGSFTTSGASRAVEVTVPALVGLSASGGGRVVATGALDHLILDVDGGAEVDLSGLVVQTMDIHVTGGGRATIDVREAVHGNVSGGGRLTVHGDPPSNDLDVDAGGQVTD